MPWLCRFFRKSKLGAQLGPTMPFGFAAQAFVLAQLRSICILTGGDRALARSPVS